MPKKPHGASRLPAPKFPTVVAAPLSALPPPPPLSRPCLASSRASSNMNIFRQVNLQRLTYLYLSVMCVRAWGIFFGLFCFISFAAYIYNTQIHRDICLYFDYPETETRHQRRPTIKKLVFSDMMIIWSMKFRNRKKRKKDASVTN